MKKTTIFKALVATLVLSFATSINANAQFGKNLLNKAKEAGKEMLQGNDSQQSNQQSSQKPAQQQQTQPQQQTNNQTAQPTQQTSQPQPKPSKPAPEKPKEYTKADYTAEAAQLVGKVDSTSKLYDVIRVYMYLYRRIDNALDTKDYDFLVDSFSYFDDVWTIVNNIGITDVGFSEFDNRYYAEEKPKDMQQFVSMDFYMIKSKHKDEASKLPTKVQEKLEGTPYGYNLSERIDYNLKKAEPCKSANARARILRIIIDDRNKHTITSGYIYPTDEVLYTDRLKALQATIPQEILDKYYCKQVYTAEEIINLRLEYVKEHLSSLPTIPKSRDAALEAKVKQQILKENPDAKVRMVLIASDATADWLVKKNGVGVPTRRIKDGWIIVECPGFPGIGGMYKIYPEQQYIGGGKYGASSASFSLPSISDKMIYTNDNCGGVLTQCWSFCKL
ncbi:MAG: hypothetical protein J6Y24_05225 [Bacteroidales bacterium]|nr:hypothetical protein [Bacteroidales bacterium]